MKEAGLGPLVAAISTTDPLCHRFASLALANLATNVANQITIVQEVGLAVVLDSCCLCSPFHAFACRINRRTCTDTLAQP